MPLHYTNSGLAGHRAAPTSHARPVSNIPMNTGASYCCEPTCFERMPPKAHYQSAAAVSGPPLRVVGKSALLEKLLSALGQGKAKPTTKPKPKIDQSALLRRLRSGGGSDSQSSVEPAKVEPRVSSADLAAGVGVLSTALAGLEDVLAMRGYSRQVERLFRGVEPQIFQRVFGQAIQGATTKSTLEAFQTQVNTLYDNVQSLYRTLLSMNPRSIGFAAGDWMRFGEKDNQRTMQLQILDRATRRVTKAINFIRRSL